MRSHEILPIFVGADPRENVAWHVAVHSIMRRTCHPVAFIPISNQLPSDIWWRPRGPYDTTEFSNARFLAPYLAGYRGWCVFTDPDMLWLTDICDLIDAADPQYAVMVRKHQYVPNVSTKFLGQQQTRYHRKNWSSLMLFNAAHPMCRNLTVEYANNAPGLDLHGFAWCPDQFIGELGTEWNVLVKRKERASAAA